MCCMKSNNSVNIFTLKYIHTKVFYFQFSKLKTEKKNIEECETKPQINIFCCFFIEQLKRKILDSIELILGAIFICYKNGGTR